MLCIVEYQLYCSSLSIFLFYPATSIEALQQLSVQLVEASQTGELSEALDLQLDVIEVQEPTPEPVDHGVRASNETGILIESF